MSIMNYADRALGDFVRAYEADSFAPTLFVITADHSAGGRSSNLGYFWIPLTIFATDNSVATDYKPGVGSQRDIALTWYFQSLPFSGRTTAFGQNIEQFE